MGRLSAQRERTSIANLEQRNDVRVYIIPNQHLETPHYEVTRIRQNEIPEAASYELKTEIAKPVYQPRQAQVIEREQPLLQGFAPAPSRSPPSPPRRTLRLPPGCRTNRLLWQSWPGLLRSVRLLHRGCSGRDQGDSRETAAQRDARKDERPSPSA